MRVKVKNFAIAMLSVLLLTAVVVSMWLLLYKGMQQDKTYSGARFIKLEIMDTTMNRKGIYDKGKLLYN